MPTSSDTDLSALRSQITGMVATNAVAMVQCAIDAVKDEGQYQGIKYLFEMIGLYPVAAGTDDAPDDSMAQILLKHLGVAEQAGAEVAPEL